MELTETIESINRQLRDFYGIDTSTGTPLWRIAWSDDQFEKRLMDYTPSGMQLLTPEVMQVRKYSYIQNRYILERLVIVPDPYKKELAGEQFSYEPMWVFQDANDQYLPPRLDASKFIIDTVYAAMGKKSLRKYIEPEDNKESRVDQIQQELFGNETAVGDALAYKEGVSVPSNYQREIKNADR